MLKSFVFDRHRSSFLWAEFLYIFFFIITSFLSFINIIIYSIGFFAFWIIQSLILIQTPSKPPNDWFNPNGPTPKLKEKTTDTPDGYTLKYKISSDSNEDKNNKKIMLIACPLGQCGLSVYYPLLCQLTNNQQNDWIFVTWDYRGFWGSTNIHENNECTEDRIRELSIFECARDANTVLAAEDIDSVDVCLGHSMGVQVVLEFAVLYPKKLRSMVLLNGSHGSVFHTAFQPIIRLPFVGDIVAEFVAFCLRHREILEYIRWFILSPVIKVVIDGHTLLVGNTKLRKRFGDDYFYKFLNQYLGNVCQDKHTMYQYIRCFQELHSHSVLHLLDRVDTPTLILSGFWDLLLCPLGSYEMAKKLKHCRHVCDLYSSHATILENPEPCVYEIISFIKYMNQSHFKIKEKYIDRQLSYS